MEPDSITDANGQPLKRKRNVKRLNKIKPKKRGDTLTAAYAAYAPEVSHGQRIAELAEYWGVTKQTLYVYALRYKWTQIREKAVSVDMEQSAIAVLLAEVDGIRQDVPSSQIARQLKDVSWMLLSATRSQVVLATQLMRYYSQKILQVAKDAGGWEFLSEVSEREIEGYQRKLDKATNSIKEYIKPGAIAQYLNLTNFTNTLPPDVEGLDREAFTVASLQALMYKLGAKPLYEDEQAQIDAFSPYRDDMPDITGTR